MTYSTCYKIGYLYDKFLKTCHLINKVPNNSSLFLRKIRDSALNFDGCNPNYEYSGLIDTLLALFYLSITGILFLDVTIDAANAFESVNQYEFSFYFVN